MIFRLLSLFLFILVTLTFSGRSAAQQRGIGPGGIGAAGTRGGNTFPDPPGAPGPSSQPPALTDLDTVLLNVSVTSSGNNAVPGIALDRFHVFEDGVEQKLTYFWEDSRPMTVGFIFDDSMRMEVHDKFYVLKDAAQSFLREKKPQDEYFVVRMADLPDVATSFTTDPKNLPRQYKASGETALYDAVYVGLAVIKEAANPRKFLLVITSGGDRCCSLNNKRTTEDMLKNFALENTTEIYPLFVADDIEDEESEFVHRDGVILDDLATMTGGRMYIVPNVARTVEAQMAEIARGLKTQYIVGFKSPRLPDGKRRGVKVKVDSPEGAPKLSVWTKAGYYARER